MKSQLWILFAFLCIYYQHANGSILELKTTISKQIAIIGETVTFTCSIRRSNENQDIGIQLSKVVMMSDGQYQDQKINLAGTTALEPRFRETGRYSLTKREEDDTVIFEMTIIDVQREDSVPIGCMEVIEDDYEVSNFQVRSPVQDVYFGNITDGATVVFVEGQGQPINCTTTGGSPPAEVEFHVDNQDDDDYDYDEIFERSVSKKVVCPSAGSLGETDCLMHRFTEVTMHTDSFVPLPEHNGRHLVCRSHVPELDNDDVEARIMLEVQYKPAFDCNNHHQVNTNTKNYEIRCLVHANPPADQRQAYFQFEYGHTDLQLASGQQTEDGTIECSRVNSNEMPNSFEMILTFETITEEDYTTYTLVAENERGRSEYAIYMTEVGAEHPGAASALQAMSLLATAMMALIGKALL